MSALSYSGGCLCGKITYTLTGENDEIRGVTACHCKQCRQWSGHHWASLHGPVSGFKITKGEKSLTWYKSSKRARRGFCSNCGSVLFWHGEGYKTLVDQIDISAGSLDNDAGLKVVRHIFCAFKGNYYDLKDGVPIYETFPGA